MLLLASYGSRSPSNKHLAWDSETASEKTKIDDIASGKRPVGVVMVGRQVGVASTDQGKGNAAAKSWRMEREKFLL